MFRGPGSRPSTTGLAACSARPHFSRPASQWAMRRGKPTRQEPQSANGQAGRNRRRTDAPCRAALGPAARLHARPRNASRLSLGQSAPTSTSKNGKQQRPSTRNRYPNERQSSAQRPCLNSRPSNGQPCSPQWQHDTASTWNKGNGTWQEQRSLPPSPASTRKRMPGPRTQEPHRR